MGTNIRRSTQTSVKSDFMVIQSDFIRLRPPTQTVQVCVNLACPFGGCNGLLAPWKNANTSAQLSSHWFPMRPQWFSCM